MNPEIAFIVILLSFATIAMAADPPTSQPATSQPALKAPAPTGKVMHIRPRYIRLGVDAGVELAERNYHHAWLDWDLPLDQCALVLLDVWNYHYSKDTFERVDSISRNEIPKALEACRKSGMQVIHAPAWPVATRHPNWVKIVDDKTRRSEYPGSPDWPPAEFKSKQGQYAQLRKPVEAHEAANNHHTMNLRDFHDACRPVGDEAVILSGEELHRLCAQRGIVHLFYVGFNTNACMIYRTYGITEMSGRGYNCILLRDATTGMETAETLPTMACTKGIIATLEQFGNFTVATDELVQSLREAKKPVKAAAK